MDRGKGGKGEALRAICSFIVGGAVFLSFSLAVIALAQNSNSISLAYVDFPPYEWSKNGLPKGILVEIVQKAFSDAGIPLKLEQLPFARAYEKAKNGSIDGIFNFYKIPERLEFFDYSEPIIENQLVFFVRKDSRLEFKSLSDLQGLAVGTMRGYTYGPDFDNNPLFIRQPANSHENNLRKLFYGRIDAYPCDKLVGIHVATTIGVMSELKILSPPLQVMKGHIGFTKGKFIPEIASINRQIVKMREDGTIDDIINKYVEIVLDPHYPSSTTVNTP